MNYLAHALPSLDDPYETAGAAVPDWLGLTRPRLRCRARQAAPFVHAVDARFAAVARGVVSHHAADDWFHASSAFIELSFEVACRARRLGIDRDGVRPSFLGHILVELLLDAALLVADRSLADAYYAGLARVDAALVADAVGAMTGVDAGELVPIIGRFLALRFLYDYADDRRLVMRLNQVMRRVRQPALPAGVYQLLPVARRLVTARVDELLPQTPPALDARRTLAALAS
jgi:hypothetical protein